ncbi:MAG: LacI family transcriptional regulator [Clostridia bacterium]|nr:LacI family transcriptional regulator [Clostridia bacterium]
MATLKQIADELGYSVSTISKALRGEPDLNPETAAKIRSEAVERGYDFARLNTRCRNSGTIGAVFTELCSEYYNGIFESFKKKVEKAGYRVVTMLTDFDNAEGQDEAIDYLLRSRVSGFLYMTEIDIDFSHVKKKVQNAGTDMVIISRKSNIDFCDVISVNHSLGVQMAVEHLASLGHKKIAFIGDCFTARRENAFRETMNSLGLTVPNEYIVNDCGRFCAGGYDAAGKLLSLPEAERPTACFTAYDDLAFGAMKAFRNAGLSIPEDIAVIGVDDSQLAAFSSPTLSSISMPVVDVGERAAEFILRRIGGDKSPYQTLYLTPTLKIRESSGGKI